MQRSFNTVTIDSDWEFKDRSNKAKFNLNVFLSGLMEGSLCLYFWLLQLKSVLLLFLFVFMCYGIFKEGG